MPKARKWPQALRRGAAVIMVLRYLKPDAAIGESVLARTEALPHSSSEELRSTSKCAPHRGQDGLHA